MAMMVLEKRYYFSLTDFGGCQTIILRISPVFYFGEVISAEGEFKEEGFVGCRFE